jgi:hypothetical protein
MGKYHMQTVFEVPGWVVFAYEWRHGAVGLRGCMRMELG